MIDMNKTLEVEKLTKIFNSRYPLLQTEEGRQALVRQYHKDIAALESNGFCSWDKLERLISSIISQIGNNKYDLIIGLNRGGIIPSVLMSHKIKVKHGVMTVQSYDGKKQNKVCLLDNDISMIGSIDRQDRVLIVDDIADSGRTLNEVLRVLDSRYIPRKKIDTATLYYRDGSTFKPTYYGEKINDSAWINFVWEKD